MTRHKYGGPWTRLKLAILGDYLNFYTNALKNTPFTLHYADAFAGTGDQSFEVPEGQELIFQIEDMEGSVKVALGIDPPFDRYHFNDLSEEHCQAIHEVVACDTDKASRTKITRMDGNDFVKQFCQELTRNDRAILFIDPYSTELAWETLQSVAASGQIDLWLLFPISALLRMTPKDPGKLDPSWEKKINRLLGTDSWVDALYKPKPGPHIEDLFGESSDPVSERINVQEVSQFVKGRLEEQFSFVAEPATLYANGTPLFLFIFAVSNPNKKPKELAQKVSRHILRKHANSR